LPSDVTGLRNDLLVEYPAGCVIDPQLNARGVEALYAFCAKPMQMPAANFLASLPAGDTTLQGQG